MDLSKMMKKQEPAQNEAQVDGQRLSKEEYAAMKKAEREDLWARVDAQAQAVFQDDAAMKGFILIHWRHPPSFLYSSIHAEYIFPIGQMKSHSV